jgi:hypothetical protein
VVAAVAGALTSAMPLGKWHLLHLLLIAQYKQISDWDQCHIVVLAR